MSIIAEDLPTLPELVELYAAVGWTAYSRDEQTLAASVAGSHRVFTARTEDGALLGLARTISDGATIVYLQDILVRPDHHRRGIGGALLDRVLGEYGDFRQFVLLTDGEPGQVAFYRTRGLTEAHDVASRTVRTYVRLG